MHPETIHSLTRSVCPECLATVDAVRFNRGANVFLRKICPEHGRFETVIWRGPPAFDAWQRPKTPSFPGLPGTTIRHGCPRDCGLCPDHRQHTCTGLIEVTRRCNLRCAFCFADAGRGRERDPGMDALRCAYEALLRAAGPCNVQLSGGEPTLRDDLPEIVAMGRAMGVDFIQVNTNGLRLAEDPAYAGRLKDAGVASVFLQFDGLDDDIHRTLRGAPLAEKKARAIAHCAAHGLAVVLVPTLVPEVNVEEIGAILRFGLRHSPTVRGVHFQPVSYFGRHPEAPEVAARITIPEILMEMERQMDGSVRTEHFKPPGCENACCSFHGGFVLLEDGTLRAWTRYGPENCCTPPPAAEGAAQARRFAKRFWQAPAAEEKPPLTAGTGTSLGGWETFLERAKTHAFSISGMAFQDAWNLDLERLKDCCIHVVHPDGRIVPFCAYNLTGRQGQSLYRDTAPDAGFLEIRSW